MLEGIQATFTGPAMLATVAGGVETPIAGTYRIKAHSFDLANLFDIDAKYGDVLPLEEVLATLEALPPVAERRRTRP